jgi:hypothetical protein
VPFNNTKVAGNGSEGYSDGPLDQSQFAFLNPDFVFPPRLIGVTILNDDKTAIVVDNYNQVLILFVFWVRMCVF